jgi:hypothetical protein
VLGSGAAVSVAGAAVCATAPEDERAARGAFIDAQHLQQLRPIAQGYPRNLREIAHPGTERQQRCITRPRAISRRALALPPNHIAMGCGFELPLALHQHGLCDAGCGQLAQDGCVEQRIGVELLGLRQLPSLGVLALARQPKLLPHAAPIRWMGESDACYHVLGVESWSGFV